MSIIKRLGIISALIALSAPSWLLAQNQGGTDRVTIAGRVTDASGQPIEGLEVGLNAARRTFSMRRLRMENKDPMRLSATTDADGGYSLEWIHDRSYNRFDLQVGFYLHIGQEDRFEVLHTTDLSLRVAEGGPIVAPVIVKDTLLLDDYRSFLATVQSDDEKRVFESAGRPDRISRSMDSEHRTVRWWYFDMGKVYRFEDGALKETSDFDPVESFGGSAP